MNQNLSYVHCPSEKPLIGDTIGVYFDKIVDRFPDRDALIVIHQNIRWSYRELRERVNNVAAGLLRLGLHPGDRVGLWSQNCAEWVLVQYATAKAGLILVCINPAYRTPELEFALNLVGCKALILSPLFKSSNYLNMLLELAPELKHCEGNHLVSKHLPQLKTVIRLGEDITTGMINFRSLLECATDAELIQLEQLSIQIQFDDPINIQFTSGTTGAPKGATLTHHNILNNAAICADRLHFSEHDRLCITVPLYHCFGLVISSLLCVTKGAAMVYPSESFDPKLVLAAIASERCTALHGVPTMFIGLLEHADFGTTNFTSLRTGVMGGAPCPIEIMRRVTQDMHLPQMTICFGMTETSPVSFQSAVEDAFERRITTVGQIQPHLEAKLVDAQGRIVPRGEPGEILVRGYAAMQGYWNDPVRTSETIDGARWLHTGDLGTIDEQGYCRIVGRLKDMAIRGGENIYPREIEEFLFTHPAIEQAAVFGVPDVKYGEEICAWIKIRAGSDCTEDDIREFCRENIAHYKIPRYVKFVDEFPLTATGKIQKFQMREIMISEFQSEI